MTEIVNNWIAKARIKINLENKCWNLNTKKIREGHLKSLEYVFYYEFITILPSDTKSINDTKWGFVAQYLSSFSWS